MFWVSRILSLPCPFCCLDFHYLSSDQIFCGFKLKKIVEFVEKTVIHCVLVTIFFWLLIRLDNILQICFMASLGWKPSKGEKVLVLVVHH